MLSQNKRLRCKKSFGHKLFIATAHVVEEWEVDEQADFIEQRSTIETTHSPQDDDHFQCAECMSDAQVVTITEPRECANCSRIWNKSELATIEDPWQRIEEGEPWPAGQCPDCGSLCYDREKEE